MSELFNIQVDVVPGMASHKFLKFGDINFYDGVNFLPMCGVPLVNVNILRMVVDPRMRK